MVNLNILKSTVIDPMGFFSNLFGRKTDKDKATYHVKPFSQSTPPLRTPSPYMDPKNAQQIDLFRNYVHSSARAWNHTYGMYNPYQIEWLYKMETMSRKCVMKIKSEMTRRGFQWTEKFAGQCPKCHKDYPSLPDAESTHPETGEDVDGEDSDEIYLCEECGVELVIPDPSEYQECADVIEHPIKSNRYINFEQFNQMIWQDVLTLGNGYAIADIEYPEVVEEFGDYKKGDIIELPDIEELKRKVHGFFYVNEKYVKKITDEYGNPGGKYFICLKCRNDETYEPATEYVPCRYCGRITYPAELIVSYRREDTATGNQFYIAGEWHWTPFDPESLLYSTAPGETLGPVIETAMYQQYTFLDLYKNQNTAPYVGWFRGDDPEEFQENLQHMREKFLQGEKPWFQVHSEETGDPIGVINLTINPKDMGAMEYHEILMNKIATFHGVTPSERGSPEAGSGLGNQSKDITIGQRELMNKQDQNNEGLLAWIRDLFTIKMWDLIHIPPEPEDDTRNAERDQKLIEAGKAALEIGLELHRREGAEKLEWEYRGQPYKPDEFKDNNSFNMNPFGNGEKVPGEEEETNIGGPEDEGGPSKDADVSE